MLNSKSMRPLIQLSSKTVSLIGPDKFNRVAKINARIKAEGDLISDLQTLHGSGLKQQLLAEVQTTSEDRNYARFKIRAAGYLLRVLNSRGEPAALETIRQLADVKCFSNFHA